MKWQNAAYLSRFSPRLMGLDATTTDSFEDAVVVREKAGLYAEVIGCAAGGSRFCAYFSIKSSMFAFRSDCGMRFIRISRRDLRP